MGSLLYKGAFVDAPFIPERRWATRLRVRVSGLVDGTGFRGQVTGAGYLPEFRQCAWLMANASLRFRDEDLGASSSSECGVGLGMKGLGLPKLGVGSRGDGPRRRGILSEPLHPWFRVINSIVFSANVESRRRSLQNKGLCKKRNPAPSLKQLRLH